jgi:hypothetical protein
VWKDRIPLGALALLAGREGIGKSTIAYQLAADITCGNLPGVHLEQPKAVLVAATEDSWEHTIVPRLMAAAADLDKVYRVDVVTIEDNVTGLALPRDNHNLEKAIHAVDAALILLDPLMSRLDAKLDTHKDAEVRIALEPLTALADRTGVSVLGLIHVNKTTSTDPLTVIMASRAFVAVARSVLFAAKDPDDPRTRYLGTPKNNLGQTDLPTLTYDIQSVHVADTDEGPVYTGRINWIGETDRDIADLLADSGESPDVRTAVADAADWLTDYLTSVGGVSAHTKIKDEGKRAGGHSKSSLDRARVKLRLVVESGGFPRQTYWRLPPPRLFAPTPETTGANGQVAQMGAANAVISQSSRPGTTEITETTETTAETTIDNNKRDPSALPPRGGVQNVQSSQSSQSYRPPARAPACVDDPWNAWPPDTQGAAINPTRTP